MMSSEYSISQIYQMLTILGKPKVNISACGVWPEHISSIYGHGALFFFTKHGSLIVRTFQNNTITWSGPIDIDVFWTRKISQSLSYQCARLLKSSQDRTGIKDIKNLLCKFHNFKYIPSNIII